MHKTEKKPEEQYFLWIVHYSENETAEGLLQSKIKSGEKNHPFLSLTSCNIRIF